MRTGSGAGNASAALTLAATALLLSAVAGVAMERNVTVVDNAFDPQQVTVAAGDPVVWRWSDDNENPHTVTALDGSFDSDSECDPDDLSPCRRPGQSFSVVLTEPGTYAYQCRVHPVTMVGTVEVVAAGESPGDEDVSPPPARESPGEEPSEEASHDGATASPSPSRSSESRETSAPARGSAGPPAFRVGEVPSASASGSVADPLVASPAPPIASTPVLEPTAAPSGAAAAIDLSERPGGWPRRSIVLVAGGLLVLSAVALARFVVFGRRW